MRRAATLLAVLGATACAREPAPSTSSRARAPAAGCAGCHAEIATEWEASFHRRAFTDEAFQAGLAIEDERDRHVCIACHAPARATAGVTAGVHCTTCHDAGFEAPHGRRAARTSAEVRCAGCHEFPFEDNPAEMMQATVREHASSAFAAVACIDCHMPSRAGHRDHRFVASHAPAALAKQVHVDAEKIDGSRVRVRIRSDAGHAFPTGDMFRRVRLEVFAEGARGEIVGSAERVFQRSWAGLTRPGLRPGARTEVSDTRVRGTWEEVLPLEPSAPVVRVRWLLHYERPVAVRGPRSLLASSDVVAEGEVLF